MKRYDNEWYTGIIRTCIYSDDFENDIILKIDGDFKNDVDRSIYAEQLCNLLNMKDKIYEYMDELYGYKTEENVIDLLNKLIESHSRLRQFNLEKEKDIQKYRDEGYKKGYQYGLENCKNNYISKESIINFIENENND